MNNVVTVTNLVGKLTIPTWPQLFTVDVKQKIKQTKTS